MLSLFAAFAVGVASVESLRFVARHLAHRAYEARELARYRAEEEYLPLK